MKRFAPLLAAASLLSCGSSGGGATSGTATSSSSSTSSASSTSTSASSSSTSSSAGASSSSGGSGDTWASWAQGFFAMYCVECHGATDPKMLDFTKYSVVDANKSEIACGTAKDLQAGCMGFPPPQQFPIDDAAKTNPKPTDAERDRLIAWIQAGAAM